MGTQNEDQNAERVRDRNRNNDSKGDEKANAEKDPAGNPIDDQELVGGISTNSPTNQQPSASQNNQWEQDHNTNSAPITGQQGFGGYEGHDKSTNKYSPQEDDDLEAEQSKNLRSDHVEDNDLENKDQDYRDGVNQSGEDLDDEDELRNGK